MEIWGYGIGGLQDLGTAGEDKNACRVPPGRSISSKGPKTPCPWDGVFGIFCNLPAGALEASITCLRATTSGVRRPLKLTAARRNERVEIWVENPRTSKGLGCQAQQNSQHIGTKTRSELIFVKLRCPCICLPTRVLRRLGVDLAGTKLQETPACHPIATTPPRILELPKATSLTPKQVFRICANQP